MKAGAVDFLTKPVERECCSMRSLAPSRWTRAARDRQSGRTTSGPLAQLTPREREVFALVVAGQLNKQIAGQLGIAERTVKAQRAQVMAELGASTAAELGRFAAQLRRAPDSRVRTRNCPKGQRPLPAGKDAALAGRAHDWCVRACAQSSGHRRPAGPCRHPRRG